MRPHTKLLTFLILFAANSTAYAFCKLNIHGDSLCTGEEALYHHQPAKGEYSAPRYDVVKIVEMNYPKVTIKRNGENLVVSVDNLIEAQECSAGDHVCEKDRVKLTESCSPSIRSSLKVEKVFKNEMFQARLKTFPIFQKSKKVVMPVDCVDDVLL